MWIGRRRMRGLSDEGGNDSKLTTCVSVFLQPTLAPPGERAEFAKPSLPPSTTKRKLSEVVLCWTKHFLVDIVCTRHTVCHSVT